MKLRIRSGAPRTAYSDVNRIAVFEPGRLRAFCVPALFAASTLLAGCGGGSPHAGRTAESAEPTLPSSVDNAMPAVTQNADPDDANAQPEDSTPTTPDREETGGLAPGVATVGADVLLLKPAGSATLPTAQAPTIAFKSLAGASTQTLESRLRASSRNPVTSDGGRSNIALTTNTDISAELPTANVTISWHPPLDNADGSSLSDLAGYRVYQGSSDQLTIVQELNETGAGERRLTQITDVASNNSCFAVTAFDTSANESALGDIVCKEIVAAPPPTNDQAVHITSVTQLSSSDGVANVQLNWNPPTRSSASAGADVGLYNIYYGSQSQLFKIKEVSQASTQDQASPSHVVSGIAGEQACFALTARYSDGLETVLSEIVCTALVHSAAPQPGTQFRPYNVTVDMVGTNIAEISWDKPNTVVSSADATSIDRYELYQGSRSQVYKLGDIAESGAADSRRRTTVDSVFDGSNCFALTATDQSRRHSALSTIVCADIPVAGPTPTPPPSGTIGITTLTAEETSPGSVSIVWDAPELVAAGQPIANLIGYNLYQGSNTQLFKVADQNHKNDSVVQQLQRTGVGSGNACFAVTAFDSNGYQTPLSEVMCATISGAADVSQFGVVPPTELTTSALGGSTNVTLSWLASGVAATGTADPNVAHYNIYQGSHNSLYKVRQVDGNQSDSIRSSTSFTGVTPDSACFAITAQYRDLSESRLSIIVCRDD